MNSFAKGKGSRGGSLVLVAMTCVAWAIAVPCQAGLIRVPEDYPTFRQGLAATSSGDTLLVGPGWYHESGEAATVNPGVTVIGAGWEYPLGGTILFYVPLIFSSGSGPAIIQDLWMFGGYVLSDNPQALVRGCFFATWDPDWPYSLVIGCRGGLTVENSFIRCRVTHELGTYIYITGGAFLMRNCVMAVPSALRLIDIENFGPPITSVEIVDNTFYSDEGIRLSINGYPAPPAAVRVISSIFYTRLLGGSTIWCSNGAEATVQYNVFCPAPQTSCGLDTTNLIADPLFCNPQYWGEIELEDLELDWTSPCIGAGEGGTTIGALGVGCGIPSGIPGAEVSVPALQLEVVPNPVGQGGTIFLTAKEPIPVLLELYDSAGRLEGRRTLPVRTGISSYSLSEGLGVSPRRGVYFLVASHGRQRAVQKVVVLR